MNPDDYCREIEAYLCRKNDGHLIRIVGPAFDQVSAWAQAGIPLKIAYLGVDRYFERYYRKGARRRPVRIEFCEADVRDAFDDWRKAVGGDLGAGDSGTPTRGSLASHIERVIARLTSLQSSGRNPSGLAGTLEGIARELDLLQRDARRARGHAREVIFATLKRLDDELTKQATAALSPEQMSRITAEAEAELEPFRDRMSADAFALARDAAVRALLRDELGLPRIGFE